MCMQRPRRKNILHQKKKKLETKSSHQLTTENHHPHCKAADNARDGAPLIRIRHPSCDDLSPDAQRAVDAIEFITENMKDDETTKQYRDDWKFVAMVVDRVLLYGFFGITLGGTIGILFSAPTVFERVDEQKHLQKLIQLYKQGLPENDTFTSLY
ncbi:unnamed protein product [Haemonchus placei]|uniref:Neur_chan_memb domain-containing protein n=1 Tax=Haemonchus placei TaxID=6290 RepID=A0A0N4XB07_HAEPC|nr:unnamed protein product [Haemonchus placei]